MNKEYIGYDGILPTIIIHNLRNNISKVTNQDKAAMKREISIPWEQQTVLSAYFKKIETAKKKLEKWNVIVSEEDIIMQEIYESKWFTNLNIKIWEEKDDRNK